MGQSLACYSLNSSQQHKYGKKVLIVGLKGAGKTTIFYRLLNRPAPMLAQFRETIVDTIKKSGGKVILMEVNAQHRLQGKKWIDQLPPCQGLIWVVDSHDHGKMAESGECLKTAMARLRRVPLLVLANKDDIISAANLSEVSSNLELQLYKNHIIEACCANTGAGLGAAMEWLETFIS